MLVEMHGPGLQIRMYNRYTDDGNFAGGDSGGNRMPRLFLVSFPTNKTQKMSETTKYT